MKNEGPNFIYSMVPLQKTSFRNFFESGPLKSLLENPGELRYAGWDLTTRSRARIVKGQYLELKSAERKLLHVYEDGSFFVRVAGDNEYLSWGMNDENWKQFPRLNTLAVVEFTLNFSLLCSKLTDFLTPSPSRFSLAVEIRNAISGNIKLRLIPYAVSSNWFSFGEGSEPAPEQSMRRHVQVPFEQMKKTPETVAYLLVKQIFVWFGITTEKIPYTSGDQEKFIDPEKIRNSRSG